MKRSLKQIFCLRLLVYMLLVFAGTFATIEVMLAIQDWMTTQ
ncbi:MAG: hypothetical protein NZ805_15075 [Armatimonadetes bacterium]|nr:hypothetical protein [Armatimonadota bacterium]